MKEREPVQEKGLTWRGRLKKSCLTISLYIGIVIGGFVFGTISPKLINQLMHFMKEQSYIYFFKDGTKERIEEQKIAAKTILEFLEISNTIIQEKEKKCLEIKDPQKLNLVIKFLAHRLKDSNEKILSEIFIFKDVTHYNISHEMKNMYYLVDDASLEFNFCNANKEITSALIQQKILHLSENLNKYFLEKEK